MLHRLTLRLSSLSSGKRMRFELVVMRVAVVWADREIITFDPIKVLRGTSKAYKAALLQIRYMYCPAWLAWSSLHRVPLHSNCLYRQRDSTNRRKYWTWWHLGHRLDMVSVVVSGPIAASPQRQPMLQQDPAKCFEPLPDQYLEVHNVEERSLKVSTA